MSVAGCKGSNNETAGRRMLVFFFMLRLVCLSVSKVYSLIANLDRGCTGILLLILPHRDLSLVLYVSVCLY